MDLRSGAEEQFSGREAARSAFARFLGLFDFRLLQQYLPRPEVDARPIVIVHFVALLDVLRISRVRRAA
jgi:hypothetical protein